MYSAREPGRTHEDIDQGNRGAGLRAVLSDREAESYDNTP